LGDKKEGSTRKRNLIVGGVIVLLAVLGFAGCLVVGCTDQRRPPADAFEPTSQLNYHNGYWVTKMKPPGQLFSIKVINDMHVDAATNRVTVYAQSRLLGKVVTPPQVGPGECTESANGDTVCFHPNAVYLNGSGKELLEADGTGAWWVKHSWILGGEGYENCELRPQESYDDCFWVEGELMEDGLAMKVGAVDPDSSGEFYNIRTPVFDEDKVTYKVTRFSPTNLDPNAGEIDLTPKSDFVLNWECEQEISAFDNRARSCPKTVQE
jgi:hypothetical protein